MKIKTLFTCITSLLLFYSNLQAQYASKKLVDFVNPFIGTGSVDATSFSGSNFPGASVPFGFIQLSPDSRNVTLGETSAGYFHSDKTILGFSHTHLNGTGIAELFDVLIMPATGDMNTEINAKTKKVTSYISRIDHEKEKARPGYYQVNLLDYNINAELTATEHVGVHRYTFPENKNSHILIDMGHTMQNWVSVKMITSRIRVIDNQTIEGYRIMGGWIDGVRKVYFRAEFSRPFDSHSLIDIEMENVKELTFMGESYKALLDFDTKANDTILVKVGLSATSLENARLNLSTEVPDWDFEKVATDATNLWEKELQKISIEGTKEQKEMFYTGLYHAFIQPNNMADVNGDYPGADMVVRNAPDKKHYTTFSLWDTYRATHPLYTLVQPKLTANFINSMIRQSESFGFLPVWQLWGLENYCMIGNHSIPVIVDAALKGLTGFDLEQAYSAVKTSSIIDHKNLPYTAWEKYGYIPEHVQANSVSVALEVAYDDWCVAQLAKKLGKMADYDHFMKRSSFYKNIFDAKTNFFRSKDKNGKWTVPFNTLTYGGPYTEGNAWQYAFYVPQDMSGLVTLMGGSNAFCAKLDTFFELTDKPEWVDGNASGLIGQYAHGNEPSQHVAYLYNFAGQPWKTQKLVAQIQKEMYNNSFSGYAGNDDCGQMSAWYIFSAMGFYPVNPANGVYVIGSPSLKSAEIKLENGKTFKTLVKNASNDNPYIQSAKLNGKPYTKTYITQNDIVSGGVLEFVMGKLPNKKWGVKAEDVPSAWGY